MIITIFIIHVNFYSKLYSFNLSKAIKEEFLDLYITTIDDLKTELTAIVIKDTKLILENHIFFQAYFKELQSIGFINEGKNILQNFTENNNTFLYSGLNKIINVDVNFTVDLDIGREKIDGRECDQLGKYAKIYFYMFPHI